jgi:hypothetical protein
MSSSAREGRESGKTRCLSPGVATLFTARCITLVSAGICALPAHKAFRQPKRPISVPLRIIAQPGFLWHLPITPVYIAYGPTARGFKRTGGGEK